MSVWISLFVLQLITGMASSMGFLYDSTHITPAGMASPLGFL